MPRISNYAANAQIMRYMFQTQVRLNDYHAQVNSEQISPNYAGIARDSQFLVNMENARSSIAEFMTNNNTTDFRLQIMETSISGMDDAITEFMNTLKNRPLSQSSTKNEVLDLQRWAFDSMVTLESHLNTKSDGRYVYGGSRVTTEAVDFKLTSLEDFQTKYDGSTVSYSTTREMHISDFSMNADTTNQLQSLADSNNWLTFRRDSDGFTQTGGTGTIEATSGMFSNVIVGSTIDVTNSTSNNGTYTVKGVSADGATVTVETKMLTNERFISQLGTSETIPTALTTEAANITAIITRQDGTQLLPGATTSLSFNNGTGVITAGTAGSLTGLAAGDVISVSGTTSNNATYVIDSVDGTNNFLTIRSNATTIDLNNGTQLNNSNFGNLTFDQLTGSVTAATAGAFSAVSTDDIISLGNTFNNDGLITVDSISTDGTTITFKFNDAVQLSYDNGNKTLEGLGNLTFDRNGKTLTSTTADFTEIVVGDVLIVDNTGENDGRWIVSGVSADGKTLTFDTTMLTDEGLSTGTKFFDYSTGTRSVFDATANTIKVQSSVPADLPGVFSDLQKGDSLVVAGSTVAPPTFTKVEFTAVGLDQDTIQVVSDGGAAIPGVFSDVSVGDTVTLANSAANNGGHVVNWVSKDGSTIRVDGNLAGTSTDTNSIDFSGATFTDFSTRTNLRFEDLGGVTDRIHMEDSVANTAIANAFADMSVGMTITIAGATSGANNGTFKITAVNAAGYIDVEAYPTAGDPGLVAEDSVVGTSITASGNDGTYTIESVSTDGSTVTFSGTTQLLAAQTDTNGTNFTTSGFDYTSGTKLYVDTAADTIEVLRKDTGATVTNAFDALRVGQTLTASNLANATNNLAYTIKTIAAGVITTNENIPITESDPKASLSVYAASGTVQSDSYYKGDNVTTTQRLDSNRSFDMEINGLDPAFEKAIRAMGIVAQGKFSSEGGLDQNIDRVSDAIYLLQSAIRANIGGTPPYGAEQTSNLNDLGIDVSFKRVLIQEATTFHAEYIAFADNRIAARENVDKLEAVAHLLDETNALEAAYQAMSRVQGLSLTKYM